MSLTAIQDKVITTLKFTSSVWDEVGSYVIYVLVNVLLYHSQKKNGGHPWLALAEMNVLVVCVLPAAHLSEVFLVPYLRSLEDSSHGWARRAAQHVVAFTVVFHSVWTVVMIMCTRCMFKRHVQRLDRARDRGRGRGRGGVPSDEEAALTKEM